MTREEVKKYIDDNFVFLAISDSYSLVDKIYNDFEQRNTELEQQVKELQEPKTCDGCVYWTLGGGCSGNFMIKCNRFPHLVDRFKPKQN